MNNKSNKIATITFSNSTNFGAILQTYALQKAILNMGYETEVIDYECNFVYKPYTLKSFKERGIKAYIMSSILYLTRIPRMNKFKKFRSKILFSEKVNSESIKKISNSYAAYIVGSDQVWNNKITGFDKNFFLDFVKDNRKKCSYAASFGVSKINNNLVDEYKRLLGSFNHLLVREEKGCEIIKDLIQREVNTVLDPTLLITKEEWMDLASSKRYDGDYVLVYQMGISTTMLKFAKKLAKRNGCKIVIIPFPLGSMVNAKWEVSSGPEEWLGLFRDAKYIVTDSFHGTVFSIKFNKEFFTEVSPMVKGLSSRIDTILGSVGLTNRLIVNGDNDYIDEKINYEKVNEKLEKQVTKSLQYLKEMIEETIRN